MTKRAKIWDKQIIVIATPQIAKRKFSVVSHTFHTVFKVLFLYVKNEINSRDRYDDGGGSFAAIVSINAPI
jgi:hypothetical protein